MPGRYSDACFKVLEVEIKLQTKEQIAAKGFERSRIFRYGLPKDILIKGQNTNGLKG